MDFDEETNKHFDKVLERGNDLVEEALAIKVDDALEPNVFSQITHAIENKDKEINRLLKTIDNRDHDLACLTSELIQARDDIASLKDEVSELKRKLR